MMAGDELLCVELGGLQTHGLGFMEHELEVQIRALHGVVGNAITKGHHIVVGTCYTTISGNFVCSKLVIANQVSFFITT
jgi:hypothetical protein